MTARQTGYTTPQRPQLPYLNKSRTVMMPQALGQSSECLNNLMQTGTDQQLAARATQSVQQPLTGCQIRHRFTPNTKIVYVIELKNGGPIPSLSPRRRVSRGSGLATATMSFWLVLKSAPNQKDGFIAILHNSESTVDGEGLKPEYEARVELLKESGMDLVRWASYYLDSVALYTAVNNSNRIDIKVPYIGRCET
ncbi:hypothetical protein DPMN_154068 [Dreissena polymorpha]|uniref:Uncharacterized protein n=1 Tax=Dreissena polymorpha TaxID=45954 RepID=A0A9D4J6N0_DREPO|nr:hypothetical protein DPMN_154068 [Dreissena polymorpha]